jgi:hypothetical protein
VVQKWQQDLVTTVWPVLIRWIYACRIRRSDVVNKYLLMVV